jgi:hypothetical protein
MLQGTVFQTRRDAQSSIRSLKYICIAMYAIFDLRSICLSWQGLSTVVLAGGCELLPVSLATLVTGCLEMRIFLSRVCMKFLISSL